MSHLILEIYLGDFSKNLHSVERIFDNMPEWFKNTSNYGRTRCSIQLRNVSNGTVKTITDKEFKQWLKSY